MVSSICLATCCGLALNDSFMCLMQLYFQIYKDDVSNKQSMEEARFHLLTLCGGACNCIPACRNYKAIMCMCLCVCVLCVVCVCVCVCLCVCVCACVCVRYYSYYKQVLVIVAGELYSSYN